MSHDLWAAGKPLDSIDRVRRRMALAQFLEGTSGGLAVGTIAAAIARRDGWHAAPAGLLAAAIAVAVAIAWLVIRRAHRSRRGAAAAIELAVPASSNLVVTAEELTRHPERARPWIRHRVLADAERLLATADVRSIVPLRGRVVASVMLTLVATGVVLNVHGHARSVVPLAPSSIQRPAGRSPAGALGIFAELEPPPHTKLPRTRLSQPERLSGIEGTRVRVTVTGGSSSPHVRFGSVGLPTRVEGESTIAELMLRESGYLAIEGAAQTRLIPVSVTPDRAPSIRIERPGRDLLLPNVEGSVPVEASATDDFGLEQLTLRYTRVSGSGEQFEFKEGELPLAIARQDSRSWRGRGEFPLERLGLAPGDSLVYRVTARDARAGDTGFASSDMYYIEVAGPGQVALEGFEMPPDGERDALSQQMIALKIERLHARETGLSREALQDQTGAIAAEQRAVRASFVFLMGGHVEDEEEEAEHSGEIQEGRLENTARQEISRAITYMTHAEQGLVAIDTAAALKQAKLAVDALQRAFGRNRYILRTLSVRSRIDPSRRLTGKLDDAHSWIRNRPEPSQDARSKAIVTILGELIAVAEESKDAISGSAQARVARLTEQAVAIDPADPEWQQISSRLGDLRDALAIGEPRDRVERALRAALESIVTQARRASTPAAVEYGASNPLRGAWAEEWRRSRDR